MPEDPKINELLRLLLGGHTLGELLKLVFNTNTIQKEITSEIQTETILESQKTFNINRVSELIPFRRLSIKYNPFVDIKYFIEKFSYITLNFDNGYTLLFSYNLVQNISNFDSPIIIQLNENTFLLDHISMINHYVYMFKIYNLNGNNINYFIFGKDKNKIDFSNIFNYTLFSKRDNREINIAYIIFGIDNEETPVKNYFVDNNIINDLSVLFYLSNIYKFKIDDPILTNVIKRINFNLVEINRLVKPSKKFMDLLSKYMENYYKTISNDYKISSNDLVIKKTKPEISIEFQHNIMFNLMAGMERELYTIAV